MAHDSVEGWGLFGGDSDNSDNSDEEDINNEPKASSSATSTTTELNNDWKHLLPINVDHKTGVVMNTDVPWETSAITAPILNHAPLMNSITYQSSSLKYVEERQNVGGGRGYILEKDVPPGTLLLLERVSVPLPSQSETYELGLEHSTVALLHRTLSNTTSATKISKNKVDHDVHDLKALYPESNEELSEDYRLRKDDEFGKDLNVLVDLLMTEKGTNTTNTANTTNTMKSGKTVENGTKASHNITPVSNNVKKKQKQKEKKKLRDECFNMLCSIHCNAFVNGLHFHLAMLNHSCQPNCVKLGHTDSNGNKISAVWTTHKIQAGEEATISYLLPRMQSLHSRREKLRRQFDFVCACRLCKSEENAEKEKDTDIQVKEHTLEYEILPWMERRKTTPLQSIRESTIEKLSKGLSTIGELLLLSTIGSHSVAANFSTTMVIGRAHRAIAELCSRLVSISDDLTPKDVQVIFESNLISTTSSSSSVVMPSPMPPPPLTRVLMLFLESLLSHLEILRTLQGPYSHAEMVDVLSDIANVTQRLLSSSPNHTLLIKWLRQSTLLNETFNVSSIRTLISMEQITRCAAQSTGKLYVDRWRMNSSLIYASTNICHVVCGPPASGKTTTAKILAERLNADLLLDSDIVATRLIEAGLKLHGMDPNDRDSPIYKAAYRNPVYETMYDIVCDNFQLKSTRSKKIVLCGPFTSECRSTTWPTVLQKRLGGKCRIEVHYVSCDDQVRRARMVARNEQRDQSKVESDAAWKKHVATASKKRPVFPHHYKDNTEYMM